GVSLETPYKDLPDEFKRVLMHGSGETEIVFHFMRAGKVSTVKRSFEGVLPNLERLYQESESEFTRNRLKAFMSSQFCDACSGKRLKPEVLAVTLGGAEASAKFKNVVRDAWCVKPEGEREATHHASRITPHAIP